MGIAVSCERQSMLDEIEAILPPGSRRCNASRVQARFAIAEVDDRRCDVLVDDTVVAQSVEPRVAIGVLDARIRAGIGSLARDRVFVHAGVVALGNRAIVIPGASFSGKTTLVRALLGAGASYFSDEFAVLDAGGGVHPYPKPLSIRDGSSRVETTEVSAGALGAQVAVCSARIALVAVAPYRPDASWQPERGTAADAALALFSHAVLAREQPQRVMSFVSTAATGAQLLEGDRGEADETARALLEVVAG